MPIIMKNYVSSFHTQEEAKFDKNYLLNSPKYLPSTASTFELGNSWFQGPNMNVGTVKCLGRKCVFVHEDNW